MEAVGAVAAVEAAEARVEAVAQAAEAVEVVEAVAVRVEAVAQAVRVDQAGGDAAHRRGHSLCHLPGSRTPPVPYQSRLCTGALEAAMAMAMAVAARAARVVAATVDPGSKTRRGMRRKCCLRTCPHHSNHRH